MSTPLLDRIAARSAGRHPPEWHGQGVPCPCCIGWSWATMTAQPTIPQSPFTRAALAGTLPGKVIR